MNNHQGDITRPLPFTKLGIYIFVPPLLTMLFYIALSILLHPVLPPILLFFIAASLMLFPTQLYLIAKDSKAVYGSYSLKSAFKDQKEYPLWMIVLLGMITFGFAGLMTLTVMPLEANLFRHLSELLYSNIPSYFNWGNIDIFASYSKPVVILTGVSFILLNGFVGPIVEELFFRGFLTPKMKLNNLMAPLLMTIMFSVYHYWLPFGLFFRIIAFFPAFYLTWRLKNIKIAIVFHCLSNLFTAILFFIAILSV